MAQKPKLGYGSYLNTIPKKYAAQFLNPAFDQRMLQIGSPSLQSSSFSRGFIVLGQDNNTAGNVSSLAGGKLPAVAFLYNPQDYTVSLTPSFNQSITTNTSPSQISGQVLGVGLGSVDFGLLYDRTYELNDPTNKTEAHTRGADADVQAWYALMNVNTRANTTKTGTTTTEYSVIDNYLQAGRPYWVYLGPKMRFYGYISAFSVGYSHFTQEMVPIRVGINFTLTLTPPPSNDLLNSSITSAETALQTQAKPSPGIKLPTPAEVNNYIASNPPIGSGTPGTSIGPQTPLQGSPNPSDFGTGGQRGFSGG